ncbi:hypothetical protein BDY24DRAFT_412657 [Mrakia frigida]|uniref:uncharacterized protein n=1 Tax=Mrakia frigida TaxID=29902 RepID=UPI003FCBF989
MPTSVAEEGQEEGEGTMSFGGKMVDEENAILSHPPRRYYLEKLWELAPHFWGRESSSDCAIILHHGESSTTFNVHLGYVAYQSSVLHNEFMGRPNPTFRSSAPSSYSTPLPSPPPSPNFPPSPLGARRDLDFDKPTIHLTLPDPSSFDLILHFLYWGNAAVVADALDGGVYSCEGLIDNLRVLGIDSPLKAIVGRWWMRNNAPIARECPASPQRTRLLTPPFSDSDSQSGTSED